MSALDIIFAILLAIGLAFSLPIWWWLFGVPFVWLCRWVFRGTARPFLRLKEYQSTGGRQHVAGGRD